MASEEIFKDQIQFEDGSRIFAVAYEVPEDPRYGENILVRFQYYDPGLDREDKTILRYDNTHEREGWMLHKHDFRKGREEIQAIEYEGDVMALYDTFLKEVEKYRERNERKIQPRLLRTGTDTCDSIRPTGGISAGIKRTAS